MRVFVLSTGRCGSTTFARACSASITNYTSAHESRSHVFDSARLNYPDNHIEVDNRLSFFLGGLAERFPEAFYVHLTRDPDAVARSYLHRWERTRDGGIVAGAKRVVRRRPYARKGSIMAAFGNGIILNGPDWSDAADRLDACRLYVRSTNENIAHFLTQKPHVDVALETISEDFGRFCAAIAAEVDLDTARRELSIRYNAEATPA
jgi:hypothetical protein